MSNEERRKENINKVLQEALSCFEKIGIGATTIDMVAKRVGLSSRSVNRYFDGKNDMVVQASRVFFQAMLESIQYEYLLLSNISMNGLEQVLLFLRLELEFYKSNQSRMALLMEIERYFAFLSTNSNAYLEYINVIEKSIHEMTRILQKGVEDGSIRNDIHIPTVTFMLSFNFRGFLQRFFMFRGRGEPDDVLNYDVVETEYLETIRRYLMSIQV